MEGRLEYFWEYLSSELFTLPGIQESKPLFNPYSGYEPELDQPAADRIRRENLRSYLESFPQSPEILVVGEAPGWRGCRLSGVPFTSEIQLVSGELPFVGRCSNKTHKPITEASATLFWKIMRPYFPYFLSWNCLPLHPHQPGLPASNRHPTSREITTFEPILETITKILHPERILAVGRESQNSLAHISKEYSSVRHPSHGGVAAFEAGVDEFFKEMGIRLT